MSPPHTPRKMSLGKELDLQEEINLTLREKHLSRGVYQEGNSGRDFSKNVFSGEEQNWVGLRKGERRNWQL